MTPQQDQLATALCAFYAEQPHVTRDATNRHGGYRYASLDAILPVITPLLATHGLCIGGCELLEETVAPLGKSDAYRATFRWRLLHTSGQSLTFDSPGACRDSNGDKAVQAAMTYSFRFFLSRVLLLDTGDRDTDHEYESDSPGRRAPNGSRAGSDTGAGEKVPQTGSQGRERPLSDRIAEGLSRLGWTPETPELQAIVREISDGATEDYGELGPDEADALLTRLRDAYREQRDAE